VTLWRLEWLRLTRTRRLPALVGVYVFFGFVGPLTARYLPEILDRFGSGDFQVIVPDPVPSDGIAQFAANVTQIGLLVAVVVAAGALTLDALPEMAIFLRTRVASPAMLVIPRAVTVAGAVAVAYLAGVGIAWYETVLLLGGVPVGGLLLGALFGVVYLAFAVAVAAAVGSRLGSVLSTVLATLLVLLLMPLAGIVDVVERWLPSHLVGAQVGLVTGSGAADYLGAALVTLAGIAVLMTLAIRRAGTREL
jgi:ABC-2 type transport system permease protein